MRFSLLIILTAATAALVATGLGAFGSEAAANSAGIVQQLFAAFPREAAYGAPIVALAGVIVAYATLRVLGFFVTVVFTAAAVATALAIFQRDEFFELLGKTLNLIAGST